MTALEVNLLVKMVNVMTGRKLYRTDSKFLQLIIHNLNLLTKLPCLSVSAFAASPFYKNMYILSQNSQSTLRPLIQEGP